MLRPIPYGELPDRWDDIAPLLRIACEQTNGRQTEKTVAKGLAERDMQLWAAEEEGQIVAVAATQIVNYLTGLRSCVFVLGGGKLESILAHEDELIDWAKQQGCSLLELVSRKGWARKLKWQNDMVVLEKRI